MPSGPQSSFLSQPLGTLAIAFVLVLLLQLPIALIRDLISTREATRAEATSDVIHTWGGPQALIGPRLVVPYRESGGLGHSGFATFLPSDLAVSGTLEAQALRRGLFTVPAYRAAVIISGTFEDLEARGEGIGVGMAALDWTEAALVMELTHPKSVGAESSLLWSSERIELQPGSLGAGADRQGLHARVDPSRDGDTFSLALELMGSGGIRFVPFAENTQVSLTSNWGDPSFVGAWLPTARTVQDTSFSAEWSVPFLGREFPQQWVAEFDPYDQVLASQFGVDLVAPVDHYRMSERSTKYAPLFLTLTFALLWLFDVLVGVRVHPVQYLLVGAAMCLFYLLELSLSEHLGFMGAYALAASGVTALVTSYATAILQSAARGGAVGATMGVLYSYLLALLTLERYALLAGSVGLFVALATIMYLTRCVDWHHLGTDSAAI